MKNYLIERHIPGVDMLNSTQLAEAAATSNAALAQLGPGIKWINSMVVKDKTFCHYQAESEEIIREHARISGFPATSITEIKNGLGPQGVTSQ